MVNDEMINDKGQRRAFVVNRVLIVLLVATILLGLTFDHWYVTLRNAILL